MKRKKQDRVHRQPQVPAEGNLRELSPPGHARLATTFPDLPFRPWLLAALTALYVARPLIPSEGVAWSGDGQPFCMLWLLLALATALLAIKGGAFPRRLSIFDLVVISFVAMYSVAAILGCDDGNARAAFNMLWEVVAMGTSYLLARQLVQTRGEMKTLVVVMISLAAVLSVYGLYQVFFSMPADRAEFAYDPDGMLRRAGQWYAKGTPERMAFENRLASTEPLATFALTNSLAAFLCAWLVIGLGLLQQLKSRQRWWQIGLLAIVAFCLLLTKSRSAYVATLVGILMLAASRFAPRLRLYQTAAVALAVILAIGASLAAGIIDSKVATEAGKSLGYRAQYWQSSARMIADYPFWGVGPGNFQDYYTQYKLPEASEEIRDPHNWLFEIAATAGIPTTILFCAAIAIALVAMYRGKVPDDTQPRGSGETNRFVFGGAAIGVVVAQVIGTLAGMPLGFPQLVVGLVVGAISIAFLNDRSHEKSVAPTLFATGIIVMLIDLLASGGILYPAVAGSMWLMLALGVNVAETCRTDSVATTPLTRFAPAAVFGLFAALTFAQYLTGYSPVLRSQGAMLAAQDATQNPRLYEAALLDAAAADPRSADPWQELASFYLGSWQRVPGPRTFGSFSDACRNFLERKPRSSSAHRLAGAWWQQAFAKSQDPQHANEAVENFARAVELYPNLAVLRAELARSLLDSGDAAKAATQAQKALELSDATPHTDKQLSADLREKMQKLTADHPTGSR